jgi:hypothetical protein
MPVADPFRTSPGEDPNRMDTPLNRWIARSAAVLTALGERPRILFCLAVALNALAFPYQGIVLDARLYSFQVLNRVEGGAFSNDLFFRFGSQDQYSLFSRLAAPPAEWLGLPAAFFLIYLVCNGLLILGMQRLTAALLPKTGLSALALLFLVSNPLLFGGWHIFQVNEPYLTSRNPATALTLLGLAEMLRGRHLLALLLLVGGCLLHPLMGIGGVAILFIWVALQNLPRRAVLPLAVAAGLVAVVVLIYPPVAARVFGQMDEEWLTQVRYATAYNFPDEWSASDWMQMVVPLTLVVAAAWLGRSDKRLSRLGWAVALVSAGGLLASVVASRNGYTLLFQAQPYRAVWLLKVHYVPLGFWLAADLWQRATEAARVAAVVVVGSMALTTFIPAEFILPLCFVLPLVLFLRGVESKPRVAGWKSQTLACGLLLGLFAWGTYKFGLIVAFREPLIRFHGGMYAVGQMLNSLGPVFWCVAALWVLARVYRHVGFGPGTAAWAVAVGVAVQTAVFLIPFTDFYQTRYKRAFDDIQFVSHVVDRQPRAACEPRPTVYWSTGLVDILWIDLRVNSFYEFSQIQGILFSRDTAVEGTRRARLVRQFEADRLREEKILLPDRWCELLENLYGVRIEDAAPTRDDLLRLCREPELDFVVSPHNFDGLYSETNGRVYVYDCERIRRTQPASPYSTRNPRP